MGETREEIGYRRKKTKTKRYSSEIGLGPRRQEQARAE